MVKAIWAVACTVLAVALRVRRIECQRFFADGRRGGARRNDGTAHGNAEDPRTSSQEASRFPNPSP
jgi:hypothetical protein